MQNIKVAVVGDVHSDWNEYDCQALNFLKVDLVLFVGDFGNESLPIVRSVAELKIPKAVILGNHDAWFTATPWGRKRSPYDHKIEDRVQEQLDLLNITHVGYGYLDFPRLEISVVGSRPFSWGGSQWKYEEFYQQRYGVTSFAESTAKIMSSVEKTKYDNLIFIGHNGPFGLGDQPEDICGRDWNPLGGDFGDPDFQDAIALSRQQGKNISLVTFGHMHHSLRHTKKRLRTIINQDEQKTVYLNAASTPRIEEIEGETIHKFSIVDFWGGEISSIKLVAITEKMKVKYQQNLFASPKLIG